MIRWQTNDSMSTPSLVRTRLSYITRRTAFTPVAPGLFGADGGIRTHTRQALDLLPLPIGLHRRYLVPDGGYAPPIPGYKAGVILISPIGLYQDGVPCFFVLFTLLEVRSG